MSKLFRSARCSIALLASSAWVMTSTSVFSQEAETVIKPEPKQIPAEQPQLQHKSTEASGFWQVVTVFLTVTGAVGGFGWHLVSNKGAILFPALKRIESDSGEQTLVKKVVVWKLGLRGVTRSEHEERATVKKTNGYYLGFLNDVLIGIITANSLHLAIAGIVDYQSAIGDAAKQNRIYFSLIALGILAGFGGAPLLKSLSKRLRDTLTPEEKEEVQEVAKSAAKDTAKGAETTAEFLASVNTALLAPETSEGQAAKRSALAQGEVAHQAVPESRRIGIALGRLYRQCNELPKAITVLTRTLESRKEPKNKDDADLLYNRACYRSLLAENIPDQAARLRETAWKDLEQSVALSPENLEEATADKDFAPLRQHFNFEKLRSSRQAG